MNYRPDVDGLRAIAILFVLFFHSGLKLFPSGFIGVDIFFVISGFLICNIIHESLENKQFSFLNFYNRRLWRLQPVLLCLLIVTTITAFCLYLPDDLILFENSARKTTLTLANHYFAKITTDYFAPNSNQLALLHTWSLSVEWQCYFILPLVLYILHRLFTKQVLTKIIYAMTALFFLLALYFSAQYATTTYYHFTSRIFEFLIGSSIAFSNTRFSWNKYLLDLIGILAILTLFYIATRSGINFGFPNFYALFLCIATGILIALGKHKQQSIITRYLSTKPFVFIGMLSYSLYIWHWPLFAFIHYQNIQESPQLIAFIFILAFILAYFSWRFIEKPARQLSKIRFSHTLVYLLILPIAITHLGYYLIKKNDGIPQRFNDELVNIYKQLNDFNSAKRPQCIGKKNVDIMSNCIIGEKNGRNKTGFLIGDSFANHYWGFIDTLAKQANLAILTQATSSCLTLPEIYLYDWWTFKNTIYPECYEQTQRYFKMIKENHYDYVIIGQVWGSYLGNNVINQLGDARSIELSKKRVTIALDKALQMIIDSGAKPILMKATAATPSNLHDCFFKHIKQRKPYNPEQCDFRLDTSREAWLNKLFRQMKNKYAELIIIDPLEVQCPKGLCTAAINGVPVYRDIGHITDYASYQFGKIYLEKNKNPFIS